MIKTGGPKNKTQLMRIPAEWGILPAGEAGKYSKGFWESSGGFWEL